MVVAADHSLLLILMDSTHGNLLLVFLLLYLKSKMCCIRLNIFLYATVII